MVERPRIPLAYIAPLTLAHPLMTAPYLSPADAYTLFSAISTAWKRVAPLEPLMKWLRASLYQTFQGVNSLPPLDKAYHITVGHKKLQSQILPRIPTGPATPSRTYIVHQAQQVAQAAPARKKIPEERWDLQASSLYRLANVQGPEELPDI